MRKLAAAGIVAHPGLADTALVLEQPLDVTALPGFSEGEVSVQDAGAQYAAALLDAQPGERVLDACAAPGGKSGHILERTPGLGELVALDVDADRLARVASNLQRLGLDARHCSRPTCSRIAWWDGQPFDRILLDAPCSGTGVIRRHPDIKLLRRPADIDKFAATQRKMLMQVRRDAQARRPPGLRHLLRYCTAKTRWWWKSSWRWTRDSRGRSPTRQLLPTPRAAGPSTLTDGFYYACLQKGGA